VRSPHTAVVIVPRVAGRGSAASRLARLAGDVPRQQPKAWSRGSKASRSSSPSRTKNASSARPGRCALTSNRGATSASNTDQAPDWPAPTAVPAAAALRGGVEPDLLEEVAWCQTDDFWRYALFAAVTYIRIAAGWRACRCVRYARS